MEENKDMYILQSVDNALRVIDLLKEMEELTLTDVCKSLGIGKSTAYRLLTTLEHRGFIKKIDARYSLGFKFIALGALAKERHAIIKYAHPVIEELCHRTNYSSHLVVLEPNYDVLFIDKVVASSSIRMDSRIGLRRAAYLTGTGKAILACQSDDFIKHYLEEVTLEKKTPYSIDSPDKLYEEIAAIRQNGYAIDNNESELGLTCFAVPIIGAGSNVEYAISISGSSERMNASKPDLIAEVKQAGEALSKMISK